MKRLTLLFVMALAMTNLYGTVLYVKAGGSDGNGSSWQNAYNDLQNALNAASAGDQIWVARGKYYTTSTSNRSISFEIPNGVILLGGFNGSETHPSQRNVQMNRTILSGEIGSPELDDNAYTVVYTKNVSSKTIIDGFMITGGFANGTGSEGDIKRCGAGWYNDAQKGISNPTIKNCIFKNNRGRDGAALYNFAKNGEASPKVVSCQFLNNIADLDGGAIFNNGNKGTCNPRITKCNFKNNEATYGAGILNTGMEGTTKPNITACVFMNNISYIRGSSIYNNNRDGKGTCEPVITACTFQENKASVGSDVSSTINSGNSGY